MGFLSALGKGLAIGGGVLAAPFTGGGSLAAIAPILSGVGGVLSGAAGGSQQQRVQEQPGMVSTQLANLQGQQFNANEQDRAFRRQMLASLLGGMSDASISRPAGSTIPQFSVSGGLRPSAMGNRDALMASLNQPTMQAPSPLEMPKAGLAEKIMGWGGIGANILGALGGFGQPQPQQQSSVPTGITLPPHMRMPTQMAGGPAGKGMGIVDPQTYGGRRIPGVMY